MVSATASITSSILALLLIATFILILLRHFLPLRTTPSYLLLPIFLALALPVSIILLVPIDLASSLRTEDEVTRGVWLPTEAVLAAWRITYWLTFCLTWVVLPVLGEYLDSGYRTPRDRFFYSLRSNGRYQLIVLACAIAGLTYIGLTNGFGNMSIKALVMALAYCWGLVLAIYLMGHGLVAIPRGLIQDADYAKKLRSLQTEAPTIHERMSSAFTELEELEMQVKQLQGRKTGVSQSHQEWITEIADDSLPQDGPQNGRGRASRTAVPAILTDRFLAELARKVARARHKRTRFEQEWDYLVQKATKTQLIIDAAASKQLSFASPGTISRFISPSTRYILYGKIAPVACISLAIVLTLASISIIWSELVKSLFPHLTIISLTVYRSDGSQHHSGSVPLGGQLLSCLWLIYMCAAALTSFRDVKVWGNRALVRRYTYGESATWYSAQVAKLTVPLAYNFITLFPRDVHKETGFYQVLGRLIDLTPLGKGFDYFFPIFILVPVCATLFSLYGRLKNVVGFGLLGFDENEEVYGGWIEGRDLIAKSQQRATTPSAPGREDTPLYPPYTDNGSTPFAAARTNAAQTPSLHSDHHPLPSRSSQSSLSTGRVQASRLAAATQAAEEEDESVFSGFAHRVKNTFDTMDRPDWFVDLTRSRPKWMKGAGDDSVGESRVGRGEEGGGGGQGSRDVEGGGGSRGGFWRVFGGSARDGQVRI